MKVVVTGASGLIGWHMVSRLHSQNCAAAFRGDIEPFDITPVDHKTFKDARTFAEALKGADAVLHCAGVNRAPDNEMETANPDIAKQLVDGSKAAEVNPHIVYANSTHAATDTPYGRSKRVAGEVLDDFADRYTNLVLPHIFGEGARPYYNNVTATFIDKILKSEEITPNADGQVQLLHAGAAAQSGIDAIIMGTLGDVLPIPRPTSVPDLLAKLEHFHALYTQNIYPDVSDDFDLSLFNTYRFATYPDGWPRKVTLHTDPRGMLFEAVKGGGGGQTFMSTTLPGITRGDHFHLDKVERFLVVQGEAIIRMRKVLGTDILEYRVNGAEPTPVDMPTLYTHSIENVGAEPLLTLFWTHDLFDPQNPDTYADKVL